LATIGLNVGKQLKTVLDDQGLKYRFVAKAVGITREQLNRYLNERDNIPEVKLRCICLTFGIPLDTFKLADYRPMYLQRA
jgi:transcriptional regulator with XRE-family HTH domain